MLSKIINEFYIAHASHWLINVEDSEAQEASLVWQ